jgi:hypothetical protein
MRPSARRLLVAGFTALFGGISLFGQGLHALVEHDFHVAGGHGHAHVARLSTAAAEDPQACHAHHELAEASAPAGHDERPHPLPALAVSSAHADDSCPICSYFAQAQAAIDVPPESLDAATAAVRAATAQVFSTTCVGIYHSRAPPAGGSIS